MIDVNVTMATIQDVSGRTDEDTSGGVGGGDNVQKMVNVAAYALAVTYKNDYDDVLN